MKKSHLPFEYLSVTRMKVILGPPEACLDFAERYSSLRRTRDSIAVALFPFRLYFPGCHGKSIQSFSACITLFSKIEDEKKGELENIA